MRALIDCHIHTELCGHARGTAEEYVAAARAAGLAAMVFTEHLPLPRDLDPKHHLSMRESDLACYCERVLDLRDRTPDIEIILGIEADWIPGHAEHAARTRDLAGRLGVEVVLGSVHFLGDWAFDDPNDIAAWDARDVDEVWLEYSRLWCDAARSGEFDVMAHPDLPKKFGHRPTFDPAPLYDEMARSAAASGCLIEISTAGLRKPVNELYPAQRFLETCFEHSVQVTVGSDAHAPDEVGFGWARAVEAARSAGYGRVGLPLGHGERRWYEL